MQPVEPRQKLKLICVSERFWLCIALMIAMLFQAKR